MKSYTDLEQSKKLAEILPLESADMWYHGHYSPWESERKYDNEPCPFHSMSPNWDKPCWSLAALMKIIEIDKSEICFDCYGEKYRVNVHYQTLGSFCQDNELYESKIDAVFAMIEKLKNRNLL